MTTRKWWLLSALLRATCLVELRTKAGLEESYQKDNTQHRFCSRGLSWSWKENGSARQTQRERESAEQQQSRTQNYRTNKPLTASRSAAAGGQWVVSGRGMGGRESGRQAKRQAEAHARTADYVSCSSLAVLPTLTPPACLPAASTINAMLQLSDSLLPISWVIVCCEV